MRNKGFTMVEALIVIAIIAIVGIIVAQAVAGYNGPGRMHFTPTGMVSEQCLSGYKFIVDSGGNARQVLDEFGKGVRCQ